MFSMHDPERRPPGHVDRSVRIDSRRPWAYVLPQNSSLGAWRKSMSKHDSTRRSFLKRAAVGAGAFAGSGLVSDVYAQTLEQHKDDAVNASHPTSVQHGAFFNYEQAATIAAFAERLMPGA